ncbi:gliding motility-associated C-terminal domain-containing protein [Crocinitomix sp.]|nr:gliding motility-associated C-terminal domain-containing protein [Crocinitomix sp.]
MKLIYTRSLTNMLKFISVLIICAFSQESYAQYISPTNSVPVGASVSPTGWYMSGSTDVSNLSYWAGWAAYPWEGVVDNPPNGHTVWVTGFYTETTWTDITGLTIGDEYIFGFYMCETRSSAGGVPTLYDGTLSVDVAGGETLYPFTGGDDNSWSYQTITFTATATSETITFKYNPPGLINGNFWNISFGDDVVEPACDNLITEVSATEICLGEEVTLSAESENDGIITWDGGVIDGVPFAPPVGTTTYTATSDYFDDCVFEVDITVYEYPDIEILVDDDEICDGESFIFDIDGSADEYEWDPVDIVVGSPYTLGVGTTDITLTGTNGVCVTVDEIEVTVHPNPVVDATADDPSICLGESIILSGVGADTYTWDIGAIDGEPYTPLSPGTFAYYVEGTNTLTGCSSSDYIYVTVTALPDVIASADDEEVCEGEEVTLTGSGALTFYWDLGVTDGVPFVPPMGTTTYTVTGNSYVGCSNTATIDITVYPIPEVTASASDTEVCEGEEVILTGIGADTYTWDLGVVDGEAFVPDGLGTITYTVIGTNGPGCEGTATIDITVVPMSTVSASASPVDICEGESIVFTGSGADTYVWDGGITDGIAFTPVGIGDLEFNVIGTDSETGCSNTAMVTVTVHDAPTVGATASTEEICFGESIIFNGTGAETYSWTGGVINGISFSPGAIGSATYTVTGTNEYGCEATAFITINVIDCEPVYAGFDMPNSICINQCFTIQDTSMGAVTEWAWDFGGATDPNTSTLQNPRICLNAVGTFTITLTATSETGATSTTTQNLIVNANPSINATQDTIIDLGGTADLISATSSDGDFTWTPDIKVDCPDCPITSASPTQNQTYTITLIDDNGCKATDSVMVLVNYLLSVGVPTAFSPNGDGNNDVLFVKGEGLSSISFVIYNRYGERIFETTDQSIGWDGTFLNRDENPGVFTWVLHYMNEDDKKGILKGNTTLIR